jgi:hypothetical protein
MSSKIKVDTITNQSESETLMSNGVITVGNNVLEEVFLLCDGGSYTAKRGAVTSQNVTAQYSITSTYTDLNGSTISYLPPIGTTCVVYSFHYTLYWQGTNAHSISHGKFFIDGVEVVFSRFSHSAQYLESLLTFSWPIFIGGTANANTGRQATWTSQKTLKLQMREYGASNNMDAHGSVYWDGGGGNQFHMPSISIKAIK